jgi:hypothetical protein
VTFRRQPLTYKSDGNNLKCEQHDLRQQNTERDRENVFEHFVLCGNGSLLLLGATLNPEHNYLPAAALIAVGLSVAFIYPYREQTVHLRKNVSGTKAQRRSQLSNPFRPHHKAQLPRSTSTVNG